MKVKIQIQNTNLYRLTWTKLKIKPQHHYAKRIGNLN